MRKCTPGWRGCKIACKGGLFFTPPKGVTSPIWGPPPSCKQALRPIVVFHHSPALPLSLSITRFYILFEETINIIESFAFSPDCYILSDFPPKNNSGCHSISHQFSPYGDIIANVSPLSIKRITVLLVLRYVIFAA